MRARSITINKNEWLHTAVARWYAEGIVETIGVEQCVRACDGLLVRPHKPGDRREEIDDMYDPLRRLISEATTRIMMGGKCVTTTYRFAQTDEGTVRLTFATKMVYTSMRFFEVELTPPRTCSLIQHATRLEAMVGGFDRARDIRLTRLSAVPGLIASSVARRPR